MQGDGNNFIFGLGELIKAATVKKIILNDYIYVFLHVLQVMPLIIILLFSI